MEGCIHRAREKWREKRLHRPSSGNDRSRRNLVVRKKKKKKMYYVTDQYSTTVNWFWNQHSSTATSYMQEPNPSMTIHPLRLSKQKKKVVSKSVSILLWYMGAATIVLCSFHTAWTRSRKHVNDVSFERSWWELWKKQKKNSIPETISCLRSKNKVVSKSVSIVLSYMGADTIVLCSFHTAWTRHRRHVNDVSFERSWWALWKKQKKKFHT